MQSKAGALQLLGDIGRWCRRWSGALHVREEVLTARCNARLTPDMLAWWASRLFRGACHGNMRMQGRWLGASPWRLGKASLLPVEVLAGHCTLLKGSRPPRWAASVTVDCLPSQLGLDLKHKAELSTKLLHHSTTQPLNQHYTNTHEPGGPHGRFDCQPNAR